MGGDGRETLKPTACCIIDKEVVIAHTCEEEGGGAETGEGVWEGGVGGEPGKQQSVRMSHSFGLYVEIELHGDCD